MNEELVKYGFVYVWFDKKHKRYYVGSHWGNPNDGYICSSNNMMMNYKNRPQDFKRRIVKRIYTSRLDLFQEEFRWLNMIKTSELGFRFYNKMNSKAHTAHWSKNPTILKQMSNKMKGNKNGAVPCSPEKAKNISEAKRRNFEKRRLATGSNYDAETLERMKVGTQRVNTGRKHTEEWKAENARRIKEQWANGTRDKVALTKRMLENNPNRSI